MRAAREELDGHRPPGVDSGASKDEPHAASTELFLDPIIADLLSQERIGQEVLNPGESLADLLLSLKGAALYVTCQPCNSCAKMIINAGIRKIVFDGDYPDEFAMELFSQAGLEIIRLAPDMRGFGEKLL